ncbi:MAG: galactokinase [Verrucomicrobiota bacterium]
MLVYADTLTDLQSRAEAAFLEQFGADPTHVAVAPGRVNLIGEHVDYEGGLVMPMAIDRFSVIMAGRNDRGALRLWSSLDDSFEEIDLGDLLEPIPGSWTNYVAGVMAEFQKRGMAVPGIDLAVGSNLPVGAGLSSSASLEVATSLVMESITGAEITNRERAEMARDAEHHFAGVPCGIMDQMAVTHGREGHAILLDCASMEVEEVSLPPGLEVLVLNTCTEHALADGEYARRRDECDAAKEVLGVEQLRNSGLQAVEAAKAALGDKGYRRARHVVSEIARVRNFEGALGRGDFPKLGELMTASHLSLRDDFEVSCRELDVMQEIASQTPGVIGARMTGGGFGGCIVAICEGRSGEISSSVLAQYEEETRVIGEAYWVSAANAAFGVTVANGVERA